MDDGMGIQTGVDLQASFKDALQATQPLELNKNAPEVAVTPSQMMNGGKAPATVENWKKLGFS